MKKLAGLIPPAITIFNEDGCVDYDAMKKHTDYMIEGGVDGIAYLGTSGEFSVMTQKQKKELIRIMVPYIKGRVQAVVGIGDTCLANTLELAREAEKAGADGVLAVAPYFSVYSEENVEAYYRKLAEQVRLPILIYNFPALTGFDMNPEMVNRLAQQCPNIMGIKDTVPESEHLKEMLFIKKSRPEFSVFCAYESQALEMIKAGVDGFVNATANFAPQFTAQLLKAAREGDSKSMELAFEKMKEASEVYQYSTPLLLAVKEAVYQKVLGKRGYEILPGLPVKEVYRKEIEKILSNL
ncbi:MAG: dihydrodipicolinate synthase family protein [Lachnospiraceae bacterium]|jgi:dihydrodipicolinate synthase/N-acetylneuraminate lyase